MNSGTRDSFKVLDQNVALVFQERRFVSKGNKFDLNVEKLYPVRDVTNSTLRHYLTGAIILSHDHWHGKPLCYYSEGPPSHIYNLFNNASPIENLVGNQTMCCRRLKTLPTREITRISARKRMTWMAMSNDVLPTRFIVCY